MVSANDFWRTSEVRRERRRARWVRPAFVNPASGPKAKETVLKRFDQRLEVTPTRRQSRRTGQRLHHGETGRQRFWPKATNRVLYSSQ